MRPGGFLDSVLSYRGPNDRRGAQTNPKVAFDDIMGLVNLDESSANAMAARRQSVNDLVRDQMQALLGRSDLSSDDRNRLDLHFSSIRDLEIRLAECAPLPPATVSAIDSLDGDHQNGDRVVEAAELHIEASSSLRITGFRTASSRTAQMGTPSRTHSPNTTPSTGFTHACSPASSIGSLPTPPTRVDSSTRACAFG
jgi:hypothetical protein